jgi:uncharacterized protein YecT (DUF1311 family)
MNYFKNFNTEAEVKAEYKRLSKINHPDMGGNADVMSKINIAYQKALKKYQKKKTETCKAVVKIEKSKSSNALAIKEESLLMRLKKQFLAKVMQKAWAIYKDNKAFKIVRENGKPKIIKNEKPKHYTFSQAMKQAWKWAKNEANKGKISKVQIGLF